MLTNQKINWHIRLHYLNAEIMKVFSTTVFEKLLVNEVGEGSAATASGEGQVVGGEHVGHVNDGHANKKKMDA